MSGRSIFAIDMNGPVLLTGGDIRTTVLLTVTMGRKRTIDRATMMNAMEAVVLRDGVGGLSIDAVAKEVGISKSSVVYDFRNKAGLLAAFTQSRMDTHREQIEEQRDGLVGPDRSLRAAIKLSQNSPSDEETAVAMMLAAAAHTTEECHNVMRQQFTMFIGQVEGDAANLRATRLAFTALQGLKCMEYFDFHRFDPETRKQLLQDIADLIVATETILPASENPDTSTKK